MIRKETLQRILIANLKENAHKRNITRILKNSKLYFLQIQ